MPHRVHCAQVIQLCTFQNNLFYRLKISPEESRLFIVGSAVELIEFISRMRKQGDEKELWKEKAKFQLVIDDKSNIDDWSYVDLEFSHFIEANAPFMRSVVSNLFFEKLSLTVVGYSDDSSENSTNASHDIFIKKAIGLAVFTLKNKQIENVINWVEIDAQNLDPHHVGIGDEIIMYGSGLNIYSPEFFNASLDKGYICQTLGQNEAYLCNMTWTPASQSLPVWCLETCKIIGIKLPVFINPKNFYQYSFILSIEHLVKTLKLHYISPIPKMVEDKFTEFSKSIVRINASGNYGSGVIIHPAGYILTNLHVIGTHEKVFVNGWIEAEVVCKSKGLYDLALLLLDSQGGVEYKALSIFRGRLQVDMHDNYYSTGYGFWNIIKGSAFWRGYIRKLVYHTDKYSNRRCQFISHSCDTFDGGSGGPIINSEGQIIGINFQNILYKYFDAKKQSQKIILSKFGFAISHEVFQEITDILYRKGLTNEEKYEFINGHYCMSYNGKAYL